MATKAKAPGDGDGGMRVNSASDKPRRARTTGGADPVWNNPKAPLPNDALATEAASVKLTIMDQALAIFPDVKEVDNTLLAAVLVAQAFDRLGVKLTTALQDAAAINRYRG